jgi:TOTE conflict system, Archaeo-Eukaryotic Primase domain
VDKNRTTRQKLRIFRSCFSGLRDVYGTYDRQTGKVRQVKEPVTDHVLLRHLTGRQPYGVYLLVADRTRSVAADFDDIDLDPPMRFVQQARDYGISAYLERSKSKGWHAWIFFPAGGVPAWKARRVVQGVLADIGCPSIEVFPKQDRLSSTNRYGNFINAPLFGGLVPKSRTVFVDTERSLLPCPDQWQVLEEAGRTRESLLDDIIETNGLPTFQPAGDDAPVPGPVASTSTYGLPPCARRMLAEGVQEYQRVSCFRLAVHLKKVGLPQDLALTALEKWSAKNRPRQGKDIITSTEIRQQTQCAFSKDYRGCGCEDPAVVPYCNPTCPLRSKASSRTKGGTVWGSPGTTDLAPASR